MSRRSTTPLFELLDASRPIEPMPTAKPGEPAEAPRAETGPSPKPAAREPSASETRPLMVEGLGRPALVGRLIVLPVPFALIGLGVLVVLAAVLWATAWSMGDRRARSEEQAKYAALGGSNIVDPIVAERPQGTDTPRDPPSQAPVQRPGTGTREQPAPNPRPATDPRQEGLNYLRLASLNEAEAIEALNRLRAGGLEAFKVPLESQPRRGNNPTRFAVYLTKGFAGGGQFSASRTERNRLESLAKRIGEAWVSEGGPTGFQEPFWDKYVP